VNLEFFHQVTFFVLYLGAALVTFVLIERGIYFIAAARHTERLLEGGDIRAGEGPVADLARALTDPQLKHLTRTAFEDATESAYLRARSGLKARLWLLDTTVTAAPLLGLLGTILGIIDTFVALARSGISDSAAVSAGIGTALYATALGIAVALYALLTLNYFQERLARLSDRFKDMILRGPYHGEWHGESYAAKAVASA
jgi:biopolymer transport protein ExbB